MHVSAAVKSYSTMPSYSQTAKGSGSQITKHTQHSQWIKYSDIQYISLTLDKKLNSLIYRTLLYVNIYRSYKLPKNSPFFWPTLYNTHNE